MKNKLLSLTGKMSLLVLTGSLATIQSASAATEHWTAAGGDQNWTTGANWAGANPTNTFFNDVDFTDFGGSLNTNDFSVNNTVNATSGVAQMPIYMLRMYPTNRNFTTLISPGVKLYTGAGTGDLYVGADTVTASRGMSNIQETITFTGAGGTLGVTGTLHVGQGLATAQTVPPSTQYVTLNMAGLDNFIMSPTYNGASGTAASRFLLCGQIHSYSQGAIYLAKTNNITLGNDLEIGAMSTFSNSLPCPLYLGIANTILVGNNGAANGLVTVGSRGNTNAFMVFNPAFLGGSTPPTAIIASPSTINSGRVTTFYVCRSDGGVIPAFGYADFTGGNISILASTMQVGYAGNAGINARGVLTFDNGIVNVNNVNVGNQTVTAGGTGVGIINVNTNSTYATNGTLMVNNILTLGAVTGTLTAGTSGTLNINGGALAASIVTNGGGTATVNMTNAAWSLSVTNASQTNMTVAAFNAGGLTNIINITFITPLLGGTFPVRFHLIAAPTLAGTSTLGLGPLPASYDPSHPYVGHLDTTTTPGLVDFVLTAGPSSARLLTWTGTNSLGNADGDWDVATTLDWLTGGAPTGYNQFDLVTFADIPSTGQTNINLTTTLTPYSLTVSNGASLYTFGGSGNISGVTGLTKQGANTLILDNSGSNSFTGAATVSGGILQVGTNDTGGNLPDGISVVNNSVLAYDRTDSVTVSDTISGSGAVVVAGGGTLHLASANSFLGNAIATNASTLQGGVTSAFGATNGQVIIASGSTLDPNGVGTLRTVVVSGTGVSGNGAIVNSGALIGDSTGGLTPTLILSNDTTLSYPSRWDLGSSTGATLSTGGHGYNLTLNGTGNLTYFEWRDVRADTNLANINVVAGFLGIAGNTSVGNPASTLNITGGAGLKFYSDDGFNAAISKVVVFNDSGLIQNGAGASTMNGALVITNSNGSQFCQFTIGGTSLTVNSTISGDGILYMQGSTSPLIINGNASAFTGGVAIYSGTVTINNVIGSGVTNTSTGILAGTATVNNGLVDNAGAFYPGGISTAGTFTANAGLTLEPGASVTMDLKSTTGVGGGTNDLVVVTGDLNVIGNMIFINPIAGILANGTYVLMTYTGNLNGTFGSVQTVTPSRYTLTLDTNVTGQVRLMVAGNPDNLVWNNGSGDAQWDVQASANWTNLTTHMEDQFLAPDNVTFDDTIITAANPASSITIGSGVSVYPNSITVNSTTNYTFSGAGQIAGGATLSKQGTSTLNISTANAFSGAVTVSGGTLQPGNNSAFGTAGGIVTITNNSTLDLNGSYVVTRSYVVSGTGLGGNGSIINSGGAVFDNPGGLTNITLQSDAVFGGPNRWDLGNGSTGATISTGGNPFSITYTNGTTSSYWEWDNVILDSALTNINIGAGQLGVKGNSTLGNPNGTVTVYPGCQFTFWGGNGYTKNIHVMTNGTNQINATGPTFNISLTLDAGANFGSAAAAQITSPAALLGLVNFNITASSNTFSNTISGIGGIKLSTGSSSQLILAGTNTYQGPTMLTASGTTLELLGNGSIAASSNINLATGSTLLASTRGDGMLTLASGQTLGGTGTINGSLMAGGGSAVVPGAGTGTGTLTVTNIVNLQGTTGMGVGTGSNNLLTSKSIGYGGTLSLSFVPGSLATGNSFKLFNASSSTYTGSFTGITPATPGPGLIWDQSQLSVSGTLRVIAAPTPARFGFPVLVGTNLTLTGSGGTSNGTYRVYTSTNVGAPLSSWTEIGTGSFDTNGNFNFGTGVNTNTQATFYILEEP